MLYSTEVLADESHSHLSVLLWAFNAFTLSPSFETECVANQGKNAIARRSFRPGLLNKY